MPARVVLSPRTLREQGKSWNLQPWLADAGSVLPGASRCSPQEENAAEISEFQVEMDFGNFL